MFAAFLLIACNANPTRDVSQMPTTPPTLASTPSATAPSDADLEAQVIVTRDAGTLPAECSIRKVAATLLRFVDAFNRGDQQQLADVFGRHARYTMSEGGGQESARRFFETGDQSELLPYFAERHQKGEQMRLLSVDTGSVLGWHGGVDFAYGLARQAEDLPGSPKHIAIGKGTMTCPQRKIYLLTMGSGAILATPSEIDSGGCPEPPSGSAPNAVIACTRE
jgi:hypothetical protein